MDSLVTAYMITIVILAMVGWLVIKQKGTY